MNVSILSTEKVAQKIKRMAYEIWEKNSAEQEVVILGIKEGGAVLAENLANTLTEISTLKVTFAAITCNKKNIQHEAIVFEADVDGKSVVLVDDVANSGKTLIYTMKQILDFNPKKIQLAVLVDRKHKDFPIMPDIIGHSLFTTIQENIEVTFEGNQITGAFIS